MGRGGEPNPLHGGIIMSDFLFLDFKALYVYVRYLLGGL